MKIKLRYAASAVTKMSAAGWLLVSSVALRWRHDATNVAGGVLLIGKTTTVLDSAFFTAASDRGAMIECDSVTTRVVVIRTLGLNDNNQAVSVINEGTEG